MTRPVFARLGVLALLSMLSACAGSGTVPASRSPGPAAPEPAPATSEASGGGFFTQAQVDAGQAVWDATCSACHDRVEVSGSDFMFEWEGSSVGRLFRTISRTMPEDEPGSLPRDSYVAVVAYILHLNDLPTGDRPLTADADLLDSLRISR